MIIDKSAFEDGKVVYSIVLIVPNNDNFFYLIENLEMSMQEDGIKILNFQKELIKKSIFKRTQIRHDITINGTPDKVNKWSDVLSFILYTIEAYES